VLGLVWCQELHPDSEQTKTNRLKTHRVAITFVRVNVLDWRNWKPVVTSVETKDFINFKWRRRRKELGNCHYGFTLGPMAPLNLSKPAPPSKMGYMAHMD